LSLGLVQRARDLGITKLLLTVDTARSPKKEWNTRNGFGIPIKPSLAGAVDVATHPQWLFGVLLKYLVTTGMPTYAHYPPAYRTSITRAAVWDNVQLARDLSWAEVDALRRLWDGEFIIKGIMSKHDAVKARDAGADGIVVSSHGGRNFDSAPAAITLLPEIRTAVGRAFKIIADSGIRRGSDIVKYMAAGADAVLLGRATLYGAAAGGEAGASEVLKILQQEIDHCLAFAGHRDFTNIGENLYLQQ
jgi:L-lactate dehydrogenase (cytochrome)